MARHGGPRVSKSAHQLRGDHQGEACRSSFKPSTTAAEKGIRAIEQWRAIVSNSHIVDVRMQLAFLSFEDIDADGRFAPTDSPARRARTLIDSLISIPSRLVATR